MSSRLLTIRKLALRACCSGPRIAPLLSTQRASPAALARRLPAPAALAPAAPRVLALRALASTAATAAPSAAKEDDMTGTSEAVVEKFRKASPRGGGRTADYKPFPYVADTIDLNFVLNEESSLVEARTRFQPNFTPNGTPPALFLNGRSDVKLVSVKLDGKALPESAYGLGPSGLTVDGGALPASGEFELEVTTEIKPQENTSLEGLYKSGGNFCSQCEAEGFRAITFFPDRPDVMAKYTTRIEADRGAYPVLLGNGNLVASGELEGGRHFTVWEDPFRKPCYLFALVAGNLAMKEDSFTTVALRIFVQPQNLDKVDFAMQSLKRAMKWDEDVFGLEYDLELVDATPGADPTLLHEARRRRRRRRLTVHEYVVRELAARLRPELEAAVAANDVPAGQAYAFTAADCARRGLKNKALAYLASLKEPAVMQALLARFRAATNMTDEIAALAALDLAGGEERKTALDEFYAKHQSEPLVVLKWLALQAASDVPGNLSSVKRAPPPGSVSNFNTTARAHPLLAAARPPRRARATPPPASGLRRAPSMPIAPPPPLPPPAADGSGYEFMADMAIRVDKINPHVSARMVGAFSTWRNYDTARQQLLRAQLERIVRAEGLSQNAFEIASKSLNYGVNP
eukprot:scaffold6.g2892.t1